MKQCPYCAEDILEDAIVCRYCGRSLRKRHSWVAGIALAVFAISLVGIQVFGTLSIWFITLILSVIVLVIWLATGRVKYLG